MSRKDLSIIIVSWNTEDLLSQCLNSILNDIRHSSGLKVETIVVDNNSTDDSVPMVKEEFPWVRLIDNKENVGFASANNQAIRQSKGRYVLLLNPDTEIRSGALKALVDFLEGHPKVGAAGAWLFNPDGTLQTSCYPVPTLTREFWRLLHLDKIRPYGVYRMSDWDVNKPREVDVLLGACILLRREVLDQIGLMDEEYFMYSEELDLCYRLKKAGWSLYWVPQSKVVHYGGQSTKQVATKMFLCLYESKLIFIRKHRGRIASLIYKLILMVVTLIRLLISPLAWLEHPPRRQEHLVLAGHYRRLLLTLPKM